MNFSNLDIVDVVQDLIRPNPALKFIRRDLDILEGFVVGLDDQPDNTARQRRALGLLDSIRKQLKTLKGDDAATVQHDLSEEGNDDECREILLMDGPGMGLDFTMKVVSNTPQNDTVQVFVDDAWHLYALSSAGTVRDGINHNHYNYVARYLGKGELPINNGYML